MSRIGHRAWLTAVAFALCLSATGCAGGGDDATEAGYSRPSATSSPGAAAAPSPRTAHAARHRSAV
jgi:hypothetical protein